MNVSSRPMLPRGPYLLCDDTVLPDVPLVDKAARLVAGGARVLQPAHE
ncbi:thiamine phosphate synthase, partial [Pyxidicoccus sp. 3LFB2]